METNQTAARSARRFLTERVRDDWDWPKTPEYWSASDEEVRGVSEFRERFYGTTSEPDSDTEENAGANPYQFDSPDSIGDAVALKKQRRKRKRREAQEEEMKWNHGMQCFVARRDAWTGAAAVKKYGQRQSTQEAAQSTPDHEPADAAGDDQLHRTDSIPPPPEASSAKNDPADPLIPLALPLLPDNPIRASIKPKAYADIFNNIVVSGRSPSVPVNLADMTSALVVGWKENGEWPPKAQPLDPLVGRKRLALAGIRVDGEDGPFLANHPHVKRGVDSVRRMLHLNGHHDSSAATPEIKGHDLASPKANHTVEKKT